MRLRLLIVSASLPADLLALPAQRNIISTGFTIPCPLEAFCFVSAEGQAAEDRAMPLGPTRQEGLARARADLRMGLPVIVVAGEAAACIVAAEVLTADRLADLRRLGSIDLALTVRRARTLKAHAYDGDLARVILPDAADLAWIRATADPAADLAFPMKGPYPTRRGGDAALHRAALALARQAHLLPAALVVPIAREPATTLARDHFLHLVAADAVPLTLAERRLVPAAAARVPLAVSEAGRVHVFRDLDGSEEHYAVEIGRPDRAGPVLCRLHSACFTGDLLGSLKCDCGAQLRTALDQIAAEGAGILLYLNQEGRGIGLANKLRAYSLQDQGFDTVEANHRLGFEDDERDFRLGADILKALGIGAVRLLTNNPAKVAMMQTCGLTVAERVPLRVGATAHNRDYLRTKAVKSGHLL
jgi:GTP cyclohydrolase II